MYYYDATTVLHTTCITAIMLLQLLYHIKYIKCNITMLLLLAYYVEWYASKMQINNFLVAIFSKKILCACLNYLSASFICCKEGGNSMEENIMGQVANAKTQKRPSKSFYYYSNWLLQKEDKSEECENLVKAFLW